MQQYIKGVLAVFLSTSVGLLAGCGGYKHTVANNDDQNVAASASSGAQAYALAKNAVYKKDQAGFKVNPMTAPANQTYYFAFDNSKVRSSDMSALMNQANYLATHAAAKVRLEGNTDNRGSREYNIGLGWRRDQSVARIMEQQGVRPSQIQMVSYGKQNPAVVGNTEHVWSLNRRVHLAYIK